jgi:hypothetical protein
VSKIRFRLKPIDADTSLLKWTKNKGWFYLDIGKPIKEDVSKQSSYKKWNKLNAV